MKTRHRNRTSTAPRYTSIARRWQRITRVAALRHCTRHFHRRGGVRRVRGRAARWYWRNVPA